MSHASIHSKDEFFALASPTPGTSLHAVVAVPLVVVPLVAETQRSPHSPWSKAYHHIDSLSVYPGVRVLQLLDQRLEVAPLGQLVRRHVAADQPQVLC